jgi:sec-independent protein translocase protein TatC
LPFVVSSTLLFLGGGYFGWRVAFPVAFKYLLSFSGSIHSDSIAIDVEPTVMIGEYVEFTARMLLAFGVTFELPTANFRVPAQPRKGHEPGPESTGHCRFDSLQR